MPVHSEPAAKFPFAQWPPDAYIAQVQPLLLVQPGVSTQVPPAREGAESFRRERRDGKGGQAEADADAKWEGSDESGNRPCVCVRACAPGVGVGEGVGDGVGDVVGLSVVGSSVVGSGVVGLSVVG